MYGLFEFEGNLIWRESKKFYSICHVKFAKLPINLNI